MAGETSTAMTLRYRWAAARANRPVPAPRSTIVDAGESPDASSAARSGAGSGYPCLRSYPATKSGSRCSGPAWASSSRIQGLVTYR